jgi:hypothetical protein
MSKPLPKDVMEELLFKKQYWLPFGKAEKKVSVQANLRQNKNVRVF